MTVIVVLVILLTAGTPPLFQFMSKQKMLADSQALHQTLVFARSQALASGTVVTICPKAAVGDCADSSQWHAGLLVFNDLNRDRERQPTEPVLRHINPLQNMHAWSSQYRQRLRFLPNGTAAGTAMTINICDPANAVPTRSLVISNTGRIRTTTTTTLPDPGTCI